MIVATIYTLCALAALLALLRCLLQAYRAGGYRLLLRSGLYHINNG